MNKSTSLFGDEGVTAPWEHCIPGIRSPLEDARFTVYGDGREVIIASVSAYCL